MKRSTLIDLHLFFSGVSLCLLLLFIFSGSLHLFGLKETEDTTEVAQIQINETLSADQLQERFKQELAQHVPNYNYDYMKGDESGAISRPTSRRYYTLKLSADKTQMTLSEHQPSFRKSLMEFHKGHGPQKSRRILAIIGLIFTLAILTGLWLGLTVKKLRKMTLATVVTSLAIVLLLFAI